MRLLRGRERSLPFHTGWRRFSRRWNPRQPLEITQNFVILRTLPAAFDGLRVAQLSDIHHGLFLPLPAVERAVEAANALGADLIALTGDFVTFSPDYVRPMARALSRLRAPMGVFAVLGNHDYRAGADLVARELRRAGINVLRNTHTALKRGSDRLWLVGVDDLWYNCDLKRALRGVPRGAPTVLLSHNPAIIGQAARLGLDLVLSGHTHGGQIRLPVLGSVYRRRRYTIGWDRLHDTQIYVCRGLGKSIVPIRIGCPPEIALLQLLHGRKAAPHWPLQGQSDGPVPPGAGRHLPFRIPGCEPRAPGRA